MQFLSQSALLGDSAAPMSSRVHTQILPNSFPEERRFCGSCRTNSSSKARITDLKLTAPCIMWYVVYSFIPSTSRVSTVWAFLSESGQVLDFLLHLVHSISMETSRAPPFPFPSRCELVHDQPASSRSVPNMNSTPHPIHGLIPQAPRFHERSFHFPQHPRTRYILYTLAT